MKMNTKPWTIAAGAVLSLVALAAAEGPVPLSQTSGGLWEMTGAPGGGTVRMCVRSTRSLAQFEHRRESCPQSIVRASGDTTVVHYNCPSGGFGQSDVTVLTPRSLRIETQGISGGLPFHYVVQARRLGECAPH
jgi:hypothetical protein